MKSQKHSFLILLSTIALLGITVVQCAWIYQGYQQAKSYMKEQLNEAVLASVKQINLAEDIAFIAAFSEEKESTEGNKPRQISIIQSKSIQLLDSTEFTDEVRDSIIRSIETYSAKQLDRSAVEGQHIVQMEVIKSDGTEEEDIRLEWKSEDALEEVLRLEEEGRLQELVHRIEKENKLGQQDWKQRIDSATIHKTLQTQLKDHGIDNAFEFAVLNPKSQSFDGFATNGFDAHDSNPSAQARVFPSDLKSKDVFLIVYIPNAFAAIFMEVGLMALLSLGFTSLMLLLFVLTIRKLMSQSRLSQLKTDFINNMSHELKTPLATISVAADAMALPNGLSNPKLIKGFSETIKKEHDRMHRHIERVLQMAESESGAFELQREPTDVKVLIGDAVDSLRLKIEEKQAFINLDLEDEEISASIDPLHMRSVFVNLLDNALKYNSGTPHIEIRLKQQGEQLTIEVTDDGIGIPSNQHKAVFSRFYRVEGGDLHQVKGFGLGLSYVRLVVEAHGGEIELESQKGQGTTFRLLIPVHEE